MSTTTTKWGLIIPDETDTDDVPYWIQQLANKLDITIAGFKADTWANRPLGAAAIDGLIFWATDQGNFYLCFGGTLHGINPQVGVVGDITTSAFADAPAAGASGRLADAAHRHGREANPLTAHLSAGDPHTQYALDTDLPGISTALYAQLATSKEPVFAGAVPTVFLNGTLAADGTNRPYTVPAGKVAIYRKVQVIPTGPVNGLSLYLADGSGTGWGGIILVGENLVSGQSIDLDGWYVAPAGTQITASLTNGHASCWIEIHGLLMNAPAGNPAPILICNQYTAAGDNTIYTVPAGRTLVVLTGVATEIGGVATTAALRMGGAPVILPWFIPIGPSKAIQNDGFWVMPAGTTVQANVGGDAGSHVVFSLSGVLL